MKWKNYIVIDFDEVNGRLIENVRNYRSKGTLDKMAKNGEFKLYPQIYEVAKKYNLMGDELVEEINPYQFN